MKGEILRTRPDRPRASHSLLYRGHRVPYPEIKTAGAREADHPAHLLPRWKKKWKCTSTALYAFTHVIESTLILPLALQNFMMLNTVLLPLYLQQEKKRFSIRKIEIPTSFNKSSFIFIHSFVHSPFLFHSPFRNLKLDYVVYEEKRFFVVVELI